jgi:hypothetical protein
MPAPASNGMVGGALAPVHITPTHQPNHKSGPGYELRSSSFEALGIAAPHPDRYGHSSLDGTVDSACDSLRSLLGNVRSTSSWSPSCYSHRTQPIGGRGAAPIPKDQRDFTACVDLWANWFDIHAGDAWFRSAGAGTRWQYKSKESGKAFKRSEWPRRGEVGDVQGLRHRTILLRHPRLPADESHGLLEPP